MGNPVAPPVDTGTGASPAITSPGSGGASQSDEQILGMTTEVLESEPETTPPPETAAETPPETPPEIEPKPEEFATGQPMPETLRAAIKANPELGKTLQSLWDQHQAYRTIFPTVAEARTIKEMFPGGAEEAKTLLADAESIQQVDDSFYYGTPQARQDLVSRLYQSDPKALTETVKAAVEMMQTGAPEDYRTMADGIIAREFAEGNVGAHLAAMADAVRGGKAEELVKLTTDLVEWAKQKAGITRPPADPHRQALERERERFENERKQFQAERYEAFRGNVN